MKLRIRPTLLSDLASRYRAVSSRSSSSASTSTSTSTRKPGRPRRPDIPDELREQGIAPEIILTSTTAGTQTKSYRPPPPWAVHSNGEEPHLKANPWADTYKINHSEIEEEDVHNPREALNRATKLLDQMDDAPESKSFRARQSDDDSSPRKERNRPHSFGLSTSRSTQPEQEGRIRRADPDRATKQKQYDGLERSIPEERRRRTSKSSETIDGSSDFARSRPQKQHVDAENSKNGDLAARTVRFKTTERVDIKEGHLSYYHGDHVDPQEWFNGEETEISYYSLRDACPCPKCIDPSTRQKTHTSPEAYRDVEASSLRSGVPNQHRIRPEESEGTEGLRINWSSEHSVFFPLSRLRAMAIPGPVLANRLPNRGERKVWSKKTLLDTCAHLHVQYEDLKNLSERDQTLFNTLYQLHTYGIVVIKGVPTEQTDNENCTLREVMGWIGEIRNTFYGETWNVRNEPNSKNVAYTDVNLGLHADLLYFSSPPRFQALHCLRNRVEGGSSYFVDSFAAVLEVFRKEPNYVIPWIDFEYDNDGHYLHYRHPLFSPKNVNSHRLGAAVNWSPPFQGLPRTAGRENAFWTGQEALTWYQALDLFQKTLEEPWREWEFTMEEGDLVLFDNRRVLHARRAFRDLTEAERQERGVEVVEGESSRWLKGCYLDGEVVWDKLAVLNQKLHREG